MSDTPAFIHPSAVIDDDVEVGNGTKIWHFVHISRGARIGRDCVLGQNVYVADGVTLGNGVRVQNNVSLYQGVSIEDEVFLGPSCVFTNVTNPRANVHRRDEFKATPVRTGASVGANATIVCGHELGAYCLVAAGAVVTHDVPAHGLMVGVPARRVGWVCACGERLTERPEVACERCGRRYSLRPDRCVEVKGDG